MNQTTMLLVDGVHGVHAPRVLAIKHNLFIQNDRIEAESVKIGENYFTPLSACIEHELDGFEGETIESFFSYENKFYAENVDYIDNSMVMVEINGEYWRVEIDNGDIFAINPNAKFDHETEEYTL